MLPRRRRDDGYVLVAAIWLLLLGGAIVTVLMLRGQQQGVAASAAARELRSRLALEAAIDTVTASLLMRGQASEWATTPHRGTVDVDGVSIAVTLTNETGRIDLNDVDLETLDAALRGLGVEPVGRSAIAAELQAKRAANERYVSSAEVRRVVESGGGSSSGCIVDEFTVFTGLQRPSPVHADARLGSALGLVGGGAAAPLEPGSPLRITAQTEAGRRLSVVFRMTGLLGRPVEMFSWNDVALCPA